MASTQLDIVIKAQDQASKVLAELVGQTKGLTQSVESLAAENERADGTTSSLTASFFKAGLALQAVQFAAHLAGDAISAAFSYGKNAVEQAAAYQQVSVSFESMLGSADKAKTLLQQVSDFAMRTPFNISDVAEGAKLLLAYNTAAKDIIPTFSMLGDIAAGVGMDKLPYLINAFGQVQAKGHLAGQELLQFTNTGVGLQQQIQKNLGITSEQFDKMMAAGQISSQVVTQAFQSMTGPGGLFFNLMERQSKTFDGTLSNLQDNFTRLSMEIIGISTDGTIRKGSLFQTLTDAAQNLLVWIDKNRTAIEEFGRKLLDSVVAIIRDQVWPWIEEMGKALMQYISSPQFKKDMADWVQKMQDIGRAISVAADYIGRYFAMMDRARATSQQILDIFKALGNITPGGFIGNLFRTGTIPGLSQITSLAHSLHIPGFATGTLSAPGGLALVGENGPELVNLPRGSQVFTNQQSKQMAGGPQIHIGTVNNYTQADLSSFARDIGFQLALRT